MSFITVGKIVKPQGVKGEVKVFLYTNYPHALESVESFFIKGQNKELKAKTVSVRFGFAYILFEGYSSRDLAETLRNVELVVNKKDFNIKDKDTFLINDVLGCKLYNLKNELLGEIIDIEQHGSADVWYYRGKGRTYSFPYIADIIKTVDISKKLVIADEDKLNESKI